MKRIVHKCICTTRKNSASIFVEYCSKQLRSSFMNIYLVFQRCDLLAFVCFSFPVM